MRYQEQSKDGSLVTKDGRVDLIDADGHIYEVKPYNKRAMMRGAKQLANYASGAIIHPEILTAGAVLSVGNAIFTDEFKTSDGRFQVELHTEEGKIGYNFDFAVATAANELELGDLALQLLVSGAIVAGESAGKQGRSFGEVRGGAGGVSRGGGAGRHR